MPKAIYHTKEKISDGRFYSDFYPRSFVIE